MLLFTNMINALSTLAYERIDIEPIHVRLASFAEQNTLTQREYITLKASLMLVDNELHQETLLDIEQASVNPAPVISPATKLYALNDSLLSMKFINDGEFAILRAGIGLLSIELEYQAMSELLGLFEGA